MDLMRGPQRLRIMTVLGQVLWPGSKADLPAPRGRLMKKHRLAVKKAPHVHAYIRAFVVDVEKQAVTRHHSSHSRVTCNMSNKSLALFLAQM